MSAYTLALKMAAPVCCRHCGWLGKVGDIKSPKRPFPANEAGSWACPRCEGASIKWIENEAPAMTQ